MRGRQRAHTPLNKFPREFDPKPVPPILTSNATVQCVHGGRVTLIPKQASVQCQGGTVLCEPDLVSAPIVGCAQPATPTSKPCTLVVATFPGSTSTRVLVAGRPVYVATLTGITDGVPPGALVVLTPGQTTVHA